MMEITQDGERGSTGPRSGKPFYYGQGDNKSSDLSAFESGQVWPLLDEVAALGLHLWGGRNLGSLDSGGLFSGSLDADGIRALFV